MKMMHVSSQSPHTTPITLSWVTHVEGKRVRTETWSLQKAADFFTPSFPEVITKEQRNDKPLFSFNL
jgi:hypothetical protein